MLGDGGLGFGMVAWDSGRVCEGDHAQRTAGERPSQPRPPRALTRRIGHDRTHKDLATTAHTKRTWSRVTSHTTSRPREHDLYVRMCVYVCVFMCVYVCIPCPLLYSVVLRLRIRRR